MNIVFFGSSITLGAWDAEGGWVTRLRRHFDEGFIKGGDYSQPYIDIYNLGIDADHAERILARLDAELSTKRVERRSDIVVFEIGINDTHLKHGEYTSMPEKFAGDIKKISDIAKRYVDNVVFLNILPCDEKLVNPVLWDDEVFYTNERIEIFNKVLEGFCSDNNVGLVDVHTPFLQEYKKTKLLADGLHPNSEGHKLIADVVLEKLKRMIK
ncbi:peptidase [Alphaproteobacteria bacterium]|nr:peptidase [Alphaproteobacteria bacterium]